MRNSKAIITLVVFMLLVAACGGKSAEEELLEQIIESSGEDIGEVNIDTDSDGGVNISVEGDDGETINITGGSEDDDVNFTIEGEDGEGISVSGSGDDEEFTITVEGEDGGTMTIGSGDIPEGFELPVPDGGEIVTSFVSGQDMSLTVMYPAAAYDQLVSFYEDRLPSGADITTTDSSYTDDEGTHRSNSWFGNDFFVTITDCTGMVSNELDSVCVGLNQLSS